DVHLAHHPTGATLDARDGEGEGRGTRADGQAAESPLDAPARHHVGGPTGRAATGAGLLAEGEDGLPLHVSRADVPIALDAERVIQQAGGHADLRSWGLVTQPQVESSCPP